MRSHLRGSGLGLPAFWFLRYQRLVPAVMLMLVTVLTLTFFFDRPNWGDNSSHTLNSLFYVNNWHVIFADQSYSDRFAGHALLDYMWPLSMEEQFYIFGQLVLLMLLVLTRSSRKATIARTPLVIGTNVLAIVSFTWML
ncbi:hypothetical protein [Corynebacterium auriscanis]|uniref:hypothetical protein n=2 Tax=Corynebacterium auriscanis TaxID=99807 RepID=UPI0024AE804B|nr:hypothetical protein [Corynebacterium auriscanis]